MIFFVANDGSIIKSGPSSVFQGSEDASTVCVVAPFAANAEVTAIFKLPNGELKSPLLLTSAGTIEGVINGASGKAYALWKRDLPEPIARYYGEVQVQFFFYFADKVVATSASTFMIGKGVARVLPEIPSQSVYDDILSEIASLRSQLDNGTFTARSIYQWNVYYFNGELPENGYGVTKSGHYCKFNRQYDGEDDTGCYSIEILGEYTGSSLNDLFYINEDTEGADVGSYCFDISESNLSPMAKPVYGVNEIVFYPYAGEFGAFVRSVKENNCNQVPYINGKLNSEWWAEVVNFNTITEYYLTTLNDAIDRYYNIVKTEADRAADNAKLALDYAQSAGASNREALDSKNIAVEKADQVATLAASAELSATSAAESANRAQDIVNDLDSALKEAVNNVIIETSESLEKVVNDTDSALAEIRAATEQAQQKAESAQTVAEESAQSATDSAQSAEDTLNSLKAVEGKLLAAQGVIDNALDCVKQLEQQITDKIGTSIYKDGQAVARLNVSATPTADAGALYDGQGNLKSNTPEHNADCVRVEDIAALLIGRDFYCPITTENGEELVTESGNALQINLSI